MPRPFNLHKKLFYLGAALFSLLILFLVFITFFEVSPNVETVTKDIPYSSIGAASSSP